MKQIINFLFLSLFFFFSQVSLHGQNKCLHLDGNNDYLIIEKSDKLKFNDCFTIEAWINSYNNVRWHVIFAMWNDETRQRSYNFQVYDGASRFFVTPNGNQPWYQIWSGSFIPLKEWHHVAVTFNGTEMQMYLDGIKSGASISYNKGIFNSNTDVTIGAVANEACWFEGLIDELRIWSRALQEKEINKKMNCELKGDEPDLILYYNFNQTQDGRKIVDCSLYNHHGILIGDANLKKSNSPVRLNSYKGRDKIEFSISPPVNIKKQEILGGLNINLEYPEQVILGEESDIIIELTTKDFGDAGYPDLENNIFNGVIMVASDECMRRGDAELYIDPNILDDLGPKAINKYYKYGDLIRSVEGRIEMKIFETATKILTVLPAKFISVSSGMYDVLHWSPSSLSEATKNKYTIGNAPTDIIFYDDNDFDCWEHSWNFEYFKSNVISQNGIKLDFPFTFEKLGTYKIAIFIESAYELFPSGGIVGAKRIGYNYDFEIEVCENEQQIHSLDKELKNFSTVNRCYCSDGNTVRYGGKLKIGALLYTDRIYAFSYIPPKYIGLEYIQCACNSKFSPKETKIVFEIDKPSWVYIAWEERVPLSPWLLNGYTYTGEYLYETKKEQKYFIYRSNTPYPAGTVTTYGQTPTNFTFYLIFLKPTVDENESIEK